MMAPMSKKIVVAALLLVCVAFYLLLSGGDDGTEGEAAPAAAPVAAPERTTVMIVSPGEGEVVSGPDVMVRLTATGVTIVPAAVHDPGTGHHHIFIDRDPTPLQDTIPAGVSDIRHLGQGQTEFLITGLAPGEHRFIAVIAHWDHVPLNPPAMDTVRFTVAAPPEF
jgi:hypothetical protein